MIKQPNFTLNPWALEETALDLELLPQTESLFALSNGHIGLRGNLDEGEPSGMLGTYLNSVHDIRPLPYAEGGYGYPKSGQTVCNITDGKLMRLLVNDEPFDVRYGKLASHARTLDFRSGLLERTCEWTSPSRDTVRIKSTRMVSLTQRSIVAIVYEVTAVGAPVRVVLQSELVANEEIKQASNDPRMGEAIESPLDPEEHFSYEKSALLVHRTKHTDMRVAATMDHEVTGPADTKSECDVAPNAARFTVTTTLPADETLRVVKYVAYGWSKKRSIHALRSQVRAALVGARHLGYEELRAAQAKYLADFWRHADVEIDGRADLQQAVRFALFHLLQASACAEQRAIAAKGLTGTGYDGHAFWDTEAFVLPVLQHTVPHAVADALTWRKHIMPLAEERARTLGLEGVAFPWRTISGEECSGYWPAGTAAFHVNAAIADACIRYVASTRDVTFEIEVGVPILVETARMWRSLGAFDRHGRFCIDGVTGPDEYSAICDNNLYTNVMAARNLRGAAAVCERYPDLAKAFLVDENERTSWLAAADAIAIPFDDELGVHMQAERFTQHARWPFDAMKATDYPLLLNFPYFDLYRKQVCKQADLVLAMVVDSTRFSDEEKARGFEYYEQLTVRDSSLSAATQAILAAEVGHLELAFAYLCETAFMDLHDIERNTHDGLHLASLAGIWSAIVSGFGGMRDATETLVFKPRLPRAIPKLRFRLLREGRTLEVVLEGGKVTYRVVEGEPLEIMHDDETIAVTREGVSRGLLPHCARPAPKQPLHREPRDD